MAGHKNKKNIAIFHLKIIIFIAVKYCSILHGNVCVMLQFSALANKHFNILAKNMHVVCVLVSVSVLFSPSVCLDDI